MRRRHKVVGWIGIDVCSSFDCAYIEQILYFFPLRCCFCLAIAFHLHVGCSCHFLSLGP